MTQLSREQLAIVDEINTAAQGLPRELRKVFKKAAVETGLVETNLRNLSYGDADSKGWRQERTSIYGPSATNVKASVARFRQEFLQQYQPGEKSYQVAAQVQRPAAQYRDRYRQRAGEAEQILAQYGTGSGPGYTMQTTTVPGVDNSATRRQLKLQYLANSHDPNALLQLATGLRSAQDTPSSTRTRKVRTGAFDPATNHAVELMKAAAERIDQAKMPYQWGGGHHGRQGRNSPVTALDCSGAVSRVSGIDPMVSGQLAKWGKPGKGRRVTIYANATHTLMEIDGRVFGTSAENPGGGAGWIPKAYFPKGYFKNFAARHPPGM